MLFAIGTKVRLKHSGDIGEVTEQLDDQMVNVYLLEDDMVIPAFIEDLERIEDDLRHTALKARVVPGKKEKQPAAPPPREAPMIQYNILKSKGIQLAFDPIYNSDGSPREYDMVLINDTRSDWHFAFVLSFRDREGLTKNGKLPAYSFQSIGTLLFDELNDGPVIDVDCSRITTMGSDSKQHKILKIKPKSFFNKQLTAPLLNRKVHLYLLFPAKGTDQGQSGTREEDIKSYTRRKVRPVEKQEPDEYNPFHEVQALAEFETEIDLHIEKLVANPKKIKPNEILRVQLSHFDEYIEQAIRLGVPRVFVIHGVGTGKLKNAIATRLRRLPEVVEFKNEYHYQYGYGATEVIF
ncbi:Smr/MutS family protein [Flavilitoribacter nigricans]|uniref:Smr/MutS family protein n=1 Tax=Flavilitoribacter nigricans TaxID=70997 RepID=UPI00117BB68E|nr:Smr/MutS family protein [Flavilitoribacter nigricans]